MTQRRNRIDINNATQDQLSSIPGITEDVAGRIIAYRKEHGGFRSLDELERIGPLEGADITEVRRWLYVEDATGAEARNFLMSSAAFEDGSPIPAKYTCDGDNISPPLTWDNGLRKRAASHW